MQLVITRMSGGEVFHQAGTVTSGQRSFDRRHAHPWGHSSVASVLAPKCDISGGLSTHLKRPHLQSRPSLPMLLLYDNNNGSG
jgi:hypothetical protein